MRLLLSLILAGLSLVADSKTLLLNGTIGSSGPSGNAPSAIAQTLKNPLCTAITPFYYEIGDGTSIKFSGNGTDSSGVVVAGAPARTQAVVAASASKLIFSTYVVNALSPSLPAGVITFLHQTSGYTNLKDSCPTSLSPRTIDQCLTLTGADGVHLYSYQNPSDIGVFHYSGGNFENLGGTLLGAPFGLHIGGLTDAQLKTTLGAQLGVNITWSQPLMSGGVFDSAANYALALQAIINGSPMKAKLGTSPVCTDPGANYSSTSGENPCLATFSPFQDTDGLGDGHELFHYSIGHWVEDSPPSPTGTNGDGAFSSAGSSGFYPWIDRTKTYYGIIDRVGAGGGQGFNSLQCGRLIRAAFFTGNAQNGNIPQAY